MVYGTSAIGDWDKKDRNLLEAYQILDDERCSECGNPVWICRNPDSNVQFTVKSDVCYGKRAFEEKNTDWSQFKNAKEKSKARSKLGVIEYPQAFTLDEGPLPTRREYYEALAAAADRLDA